jgi:hypothetical protein
VSSNLPVGYNSKLKQKKEEAINILASDEERALFKGEEVIGERKIISKLVCE